MERSRQQRREAEQGLAAVKTRLTPMFERFSAVDLNDLGQRLDQARAKVDLVRQIKACEQQLVERLKTPSLAAAESKIEVAVVDDADIDQLHAELVEQHEPLPFIADDIMETFDDDRSAETFKLLSGLAEKGQVIYLTHQIHLCDVTRNVCGGRVRIHQLPPPAVNASKNMAAA